MEATRTATASLSYHAHVSSIILSTQPLNNSSNPIDVSNTGEDEPGESSTMLFLLIDASTVMAYLLSAKVQKQLTIEYQGQEIVAHNL